MKRRDFVQYAGMGAGAMMMPSLLLGNDIPAEALLEPGMDTVLKKKMADVALNTAKSMGATYADARIGRYLNQYVFTREDKVQNVVNTESFGIGIRVIANGTWGFSSTNDVTEDGIKKAYTACGFHCQGQLKDSKRTRCSGTGSRTWRGILENTNKKGL